MPKVILSSNDHDNNTFLIPISAWIWKQFGFETMLLMPEKNYGPKLDFVLKSSMPNIDTTVFLLPSTKINEGQLTSISRLYAGALPLHPEDYVVTSDIDIVPLCSMLYHDYKASPDKVNLYGHDLTGYKEYPVCHVGAKVRKWRELMEINEGVITDFIDRDTTPDSYASKILTTKILKYGVANCSHYNRGRLNGYPVGRVDRGDWENTLKNSPGRIDAHLSAKPEDLEKLTSLLSEVLPDKNTDWMKEYRDKYVTYL